MRGLLRALLAAAVLAGAVASISGCGGSANKAGAKVPEKVTVLALANPSSGPDAALQLFADAVARRSRGRLRIGFRNGWRPGDPHYDRDLIRDVREGRVPLGADTARGWETLGVDSFRALIAPLLIDSYPLQQRVLASPIAAEMLASVRRLGFVGLAILPGPLRRVAGRKPLLRPADFRGITFGTTTTLTAEDSLRALGARPVALVANAKLLKTLGGLEQQFGGILGNEYYKQEPYLTTNLVLWPRPTVVVANSKVFDSLSSFQQQVLRQAAVDATQPSTTAAEKAEDNGTLGPNGVGREVGGSQGAKALCGVARFVEATRVDLAALRRAERPEYAALARDAQTRSFLTRIEALKRKLGLSPDAGPGCSRVNSRPGAATVLDGVYRQYVSLAQGAAGDHVPQWREDPADWGEMIRVFDRGRTAWTQESPGACTWGYGRYTVHGDKVAWTTIDGGGVGGSSRPQPGEKQLWSFSFYRGVMTLRADTKDLPGMYPFPPQIWTPVTKVPSPKYLPKRCPPPKKWLQ
jgi:TRAP-type C4-dicarboxylate transport system substrate-binding protein